MAVRMRRNTPIQPETRPAIVALLSPSRVARQERAGAVMMQEELKIVEDGVSSKSSFTSVDVHEDGYLLLLQQNSAQPFFFCENLGCIKTKKDGEGEWGWIYWIRTCQHYSSSATSQEVHRRARWPDRRF